MKKQIKKKKLDNLSKIDINRYLGKPTNKKCSYCGYKLFNCEAEPNVYICSNPNCPKENPLGLFTKK